MQNLKMWIMILIILVIAAAIIIPIAINSSNSSNSTTIAKLKSVFGTCSNNFDCKTGFHCELRDHPSNGICVIPPGGSCHSVEDKLRGVACYSGYYCDKQEGVCLKNSS